MAQNQHPKPQSSHQVAKTTTAVAVGGGSAVLSSLTLAATVLGLVVATPLMVIFSPVLVPAAIAMFLLAAGLLVSGGLGATAVAVLYWAYKYVRGERPMGVDQLERAREKITGAAMKMREKAEQQVKSGRRSTT